MSSSLLPCPLIFCLNDLKKKNADDQLCLSTARHLLWADTVILEEGCFLMSDIYEKL